jgi:hypothetical protein
VITSAALIMVAVFGAFAFARDVIVQMIGLGLAVAVFVDATVIRSALGPALMQVAGRWNWWPSRSAAYMRMRRSRTENRLNPDLVRVHDRIVVPPSSEGCRCFKLACIDGFRPRW